MTDVLRASKDDHKDVEGKIYVPLEWLEKCQRKLERAERFVRERMDYQDQEDLHELLEFTQ